MMGTTRTGLFMSGLVNPNTHRKQPTTYLKGWSSLSLSSCLGLRLHDADPGINEFGFMPEKDLDICLL